MATDGSLTDALFSSLQALKPEPKKSHPKTPVRSERLQHVNPDPKAEPDEKGSKIKGKQPTVSKAKAKARRRELVKHFEDGMLVSERPPEVRVCRNQSLERAGSGRGFRQARSQSQTSQGRGRGRENQGWNQREDPSQQQQRERTGRNSERHGNNWDRRQVPGNHNQPKGPSDGNSFNDHPMNRKRGQHSQWKGNNQKEQQEEVWQKVSSSRTGDGRRNHYPIGYKKLEELSHKEPSEVVLTLANKSTCFESVLKEKLSPDKVVVIVKVLAKLCSAEFNENKAVILSYACEVDFLDQLSLHIRTLPIEDNEARCLDVGSFISNLFLFYQSIIDLLPDKACDRFEKMFVMTEVAMKCFEMYHKMTFDEEVSQRFLDLQSELKVRISEREKRRSRETESQQDCPPPDDFRDISVFPTPQDILTSQVPFVRPNITKGAYQGVEHYLDVQFRLLREDFVCPLREGVTEYIGQLESRDKKHRRINNVRIYSKVFFHHPQVINNKIGIVVEFDPDHRLKNVNWESSRRFMFGSLLVFSRNNFRSIVFGTVADRDIKLVKQGYILVELKDESQLVTDVYQTPFTMVESEIYFEPYFHVLKALQRMRQDGFPMKRYLVNVEVSDSPPRYVTRNAEVDFAVGDYQIALLEDATWPTAFAMGLDISQYRAFKAALTREFVVIQGPPGTGKTYLGLKIARALLQNTPVWNDTPQPILVVCFTNHALDQFLEGLIEVTDRIIRIGGRSKNEALAPYNLREKNRSYHHRGRIFSLKMDLQHRIANILRPIRQMQTDMENLDSKDGVVNLDSLLKCGVVSNQHRQMFLNERGEPSEEMFREWLLEGMHNIEEQRNFMMPVPEEVAAADGEQVLEGEPEPEVLMQGGAWENLPDEVLDLDDIDLEVDIQSRVRFGIILQQERIHLGEARDDLNLLCQEFDKALQQGTAIHPHFYNTRWMLEMDVEQTAAVINYVGGHLRWEQPRNADTMAAVLQAPDLWHLDYNDRWLMYKHWVSQIKRILLAELGVLEREFHNKMKLHEEVKHMADLQVIKDALVVGMTTTSAARLQPLLQALACKIVIVEEAAEVLESHIIVSLTNSCEHLILIGDHQQLRPSTAVFRLATKFGFDISLFERMLNNGLDCEVLGVQHRMRPEVAQLIVPAIYPRLLNHPSVNNYGHVKGITKDVFFIKHSHEEEEVADTQSKRNPHEGKLVLELCRYIVSQGYDPLQVTILTTYTGQLLYIKRERNKYPSLHDVKITAVDNFQGEENDIILLSLVRSNRDAKIGFLKTENRVCVALSRAKMGFYIIGNMANLVQSSKIWPKINDVLVDHGSVGTHLTLRCQIHLDQLTRVASAEDFHKVPLGGCTLPCEAQLLCGHICKNVCHIENREHEDYQCLEPCNRIPPECPLGHTCPRRCCDECGRCRVTVDRKLPCGHEKALPCATDIVTYKCQVSLTVELPACKHTVKMACHQDPAAFNCYLPCEDRLPCGHQCVLKCHRNDDPDHLEYTCHKPCTKLNAGCSKNHACGRQCHEVCGDCVVVVKKPLPACGHVHDLKCSADPGFVECRRKCKNSLDCGHPCPRQCFEECGGCMVQVDKVIARCGHPRREACSVEPNPSSCRHKCERPLPCGHPCTNRCGHSCTENCGELVPCRVRPACGHGTMVPCYQLTILTDPFSEELLERCEMPCGALLTCEHRCSGTCGECFQGRLHVACREKCGKPLICDHVCNIPCAERCPPCNKQCKYRCVHSRCNNKCGAPCTPCKEPCEWRCEHLRCTKRCHEMCNRGPCELPCTKKLRCGHDCIGFCGETCPPLCRVCDRETVTAVFFGDEDEPDARFVYLEDCKHVFERVGLDTWVSQTEGQIVLKSCPQCKAVIQKTQRYLNVTKQIYRDIQQVKKKIFGDNQRIDVLRDRLRGQLEAIVRRNIPETFWLFHVLHDTLRGSLSQVSKKRRQMHSMVDIGTISVKVKILQEVATILGASLANLSTAAKQKLALRCNMLLKTVLQREHKISTREAEELTLEVRRLSRLALLFQLESERIYQQTFGSCVPIQEAHRRAEGLARSIEPFNQEQEALLQQALEDLKKAMNSAMPLTTKERLEIAHAMKNEVRQGAWYKCPNGHIYAIGNCGGATVEAKCYECNASIGGSGHRLRADNRSALEMDGARQAAWPR